MYIGLVKTEITTLGTYTVYVKPLVLMKTDMELETNLEQMTYLAEIDGQERF